MRLGMLIGAGEALVGILTANPVMITDGVTRVGRSYVIGETMEPVKDLVGDWIEDSNIGDAIDTVKEIFS
jgi:hypothetical protein